MKVIRNFAIGLMVATFANLALAQDLVIYPGQGQDQVQQDADEYQMLWLVQGSKPASIRWPGPRQSAPPPLENKHRRVA